MKPPPFLSLVAVGPPVERALQRDLADFVAARLALRTCWLPELQLPPGALDPKRLQVESTALMHSVLERVPAEAPRVLALTDADLFIPALTFVFGRAQLGGRLALVSLARLRPEFHGQPANAALLALRARKEVLHELGHLLGLAHCERSTCALAFSVNVAGIDAKHDALCPRCAAQARGSLEPPDEPEPVPPPRRRISPPVFRGLPWRS